VTIPSVPAESTGLVRIGAWLFRHRTSLPLPIALALLLVRAGEAPASWWLFAGGVAAIAAGEALRLWGVHHIGTISRTRSDRLGPLVTTGPFGLVRNPLYIGNVALWVGFALCARLAWIAPLVAGLLGFEYHAIVRWEERLLESRRGTPYRAYMAQVPRWIPSFRRAAASSDPGTGYSWRETLFSERGTLIAIAAGFLLLWIKSRLDFAIR
jgi:protein-S-isoprenylcysteine O-methyltransferase Ste14